ncbi:MAG TPA: hypothetical protein PLJ26_01900 [Candidatus Omnitrophota bacterium]|nr:hypothetical protein [Candidatus Omnitrophota bacterium]HQJ15225.1 hypothetical protein [Candidatus Omnitrophota bacterium]
MNERAFTVLELMVAAAIFIFIIAGIYGIMNAGRSVYDADMGRLDLQAAARRALDTVTSEIRQSSMSNISILDSGARIVFEIPSDISSGSASYSGPISYYLNDDSQLIREYPSGTENVVAQYVSWLEFCCWDGSSCAAGCNGADSLIVRMGFNRTYKQRAMVLNVTENVVARNDF